MTSDGSKYGFGIIGSGAISSFHAEAINNISDAELVGVCDTVEERAKSLQNNFMQKCGARIITS